MSRAKSTIGYEGRVTVDVYLDVGWKHRATYVVRRPPNTHTKTNGMIT